MEKKFEKIKPPKIDINLCTSDSNMQPIDKVYSMDEDSFEEFTNEWLYGCYNEKYENIERIGGAGDKGRDVIATNKDKTVIYYQCKHYKSPLMPTQFYKEFGKLVFYTKNKEILIPQKYYIVASHDIGPSLRDLLKNQTLLKNALINNWEQYCQNEICETEILLDTDLKNYINSFNFSIVEWIPIQKIIEEYCSTIYGKIRFGGIKIEIANKLEPGTKIEAQEMKYIQELLKAYSDDAGKDFEDIADLTGYDKYKKNLISQRKNYYSIETIRRFVRDTFTNANEYECLKNEIFHGIEDTHNLNYKNGFERLNQDLIKASSINTSKSLLDIPLHLIGNQERKGVCHMLVEDDLIKWVLDDE